MKKTELQAFSSPRRKGVYAINIDEGDEVIAARLTHTQDTGHALYKERHGRALRSRPSPRHGPIARGVKGATLRNEKDDIVSCEVVKEDATLLVVCEKGYGKRSTVDEFRQTNRGGVGVRSIITSERNGLVVGALAVTDKDSVVMMSSSGQTVRISMKDVRVMGRSTQGVRLVSLREDDKVIAVSKVEAVEPGTPAT